MPIDIRVGIPTQGAPEIESAGDFTLLRNMLIGKDFHWQQTASALLPGRVGINDDPEFPVVNCLDIETYLECVVGSEMNPEAPVEFLKAHAVISRSWAMGKITGAHPDSDEGKIFRDDLIVNWEDTCDHHGFDVCSDDHCQRYQGVQPVASTVLEALRSTRGMVLFSPEGKLVDARFSKCCGGRTEVFSSCWQDRREVCLESVEDPWCDLSGLSAAEREHVLRSILKEYDLANGGGYRWETEITAAAVRRNLREKFRRDIGEIEDMEVLERGASGRAVLLRLIGSGGTLTLGKELMIRRLLAPTHLYSSWIDIRRVSASDPGVDRQSGGMPGASSGRGEEFSFHIGGRGWGHGVGLCQIGAARMALAGADYRAILAHYYPSSSIKIFS